MEDAEAAITALAKACQDRGLDVVRQNSIKLKIGMKGGPATWNDLITCRPEEGKDVLYFWYSWGLVVAPASEVEHAAETLAKVLGTPAGSR